MRNAFFFGGSLSRILGLAAACVALGTLRLMVPADADAALVGTLVVSATDAGVSTVAIQPIEQDHDNAIVAGGSLRNGFGSLVRAILYGGGCICQRVVGVLDGGAPSTTPQAPIAPVSSAPSTAVLFGPALLGLVGIALRGQAARWPLAVESVSEARPPSGTHPAVILLVSSDAAFTAWVEGCLHRVGYLCRSAASVDTALAYAHHQPPALILRDCRVEGWERFRTESKLRSVPIMGLIPPGVAYAEVAWLADFECGMDGLHDCAEGGRLLVARVTAYLRRSGYVVSQRGVYRMGGVELDVDARQVRINGKRATVSPKPFAVLEALMRVPGRLFTREELGALIWGPGFAVGPHTLDVHIHALRRWLKSDPAGRCRLQTIKGVGFRLVPVECSAPVVDLRAALRGRRVPGLRAGLVRRDPRCTKPAAYLRIRPVRRQNAPTGRFTKLPSSRSPSVTAN